jgi:hypothetical protein
VSVGRYLQGWALLSALVWIAAYALAAIAPGPMPDAAAERFAYAALAAAASGEPLPAAPDSAVRYRAEGPIFVSVYAAGQRVARHVGQGSLAQVVSEAARRFAQDPQLSALPGFRQNDRERVRFRVAVTRGSAPLLELPGLGTFSLVPLRDGVQAERGAERAYLTPDDLLAAGLTDRAVVAPVPDLTFGTDLGAVRALLAEEPGQDAGSWKLRRLRIDPLRAEPEPAPLSAASLRTAAREGVEFVLRHQARSGKFTYIYDAHSDTALPGTVYSLARHAGTLFFLARAADQLAMPEARQGALRGLAWVRDNVLARCGDSERMCLEQDGRVEFGGSALTALACAELLGSGDDPLARDLLTGLSAFLRAQQRADGEMMHEYSRVREAPVDVQRMYYSGEAALALLRGYERVHDARDLDAARRLMSHITGAGWSFFGSRYYYGEEHWTCQAVAKAAQHMPVSGALDFCLRWGRWQEKLQYRAAQTPWQVEGAFGVGPVLLPRVTTAASRVEALGPIYRVLAQRGAQAELASTRGLIERSLGLLLRMRWAPGPAHLFARPAAARGGIPSTGADLRSRVDMVQHAGSAFLVWADWLGREAK